MLLISELRKFNVVEIRAGLSNDEYRKANLVSDTAEEAVLIDDPTGDRFLTYGEWAEYNDVATGYLALMVRVRSTGQVKEVVIENGKYVDGFWATEYNSLEEWYNEHVIIPVRRS